MALIAKVAALAIFLLLLTVACGGGSSPASGGDSPKPASGSESPAADVPGPAEMSPEDAEAFGKAVARTFVCSGCHTADGVAAAGPTWLGLYGKEETLDDGTTVIVDEAYLRESILDPNAKVVEGFLPNIMPGDFAEKLTESQIDLLIAYIKVLK